MSPVWSRVVKEGQHIKHVTVNGTTQSKPCLNLPREKKASGIGNMQVIKTKLLSVFATKFSPDLDSETLAQTLP